MEDIDFHRLFKFIDRTTSHVGQQYFFNKVITPTNHREDPSENLIKLFTSNNDLREETQLELLRLTDYDSYFITSLLHDKFLKKPKWYNLLFLDIILLTGLFILSFKFPILLVALLFPLTLNMLLFVWNKNNTFQFTRSISQLNVLIYVATALLKKNELLYDKLVEESIANLKSFQKKARLIKFQSDDALQDVLNQFVSYVMDLLKAFFLVEVIMLFKVLEELESKRAAIETLFNYVGNIDASISVASLRAGKLKTCQPTLVPVRKEIVAKNIYHPLIKNSEKNDLTIKDKSILITGSNMSGKSTFLRTFVINSILAQTIHTCFADEFVSPILKQFSSIRIDDNIFQGKSYYFQEVNVMSSLIEEVGSSDQTLFILDEVFKGTNTIERISAAKAILSYLNKRNNIVLVSTHDIELADMLKDEYNLYHFTETIENNELHFDHRIKPGQLTTRNAIRILEIANYPAEIISEARQISTTLKMASG